MFSKKIFILKSDYKEFSNVLLKVESNQNSIKCFVQATTNFNENLYCLILDNNQQFYLSKLSNSFSNLTCKSSEQFDLSTISVFIFSHTNNSINVIASNTNNRLSDFENLLLKERTAVLNAINQSENSAIQQKVVNQTLDLNEETTTNEMSKTNESTLLQKENQSIATNSEVQSSETKNKNIQNSKLQTEETQSNAFQNKENNAEQEESLDFYLQIEKSMNTLFEQHSADQTLESLIEDSKFVKVEYEETNDFYSVGIINENGTPKYICYALPCKIGSPPPENLSEFAQFLPTDNENGYYLMYQDAKTGENIVIQSL